MRFLRAGVIGQPVAHSLSPAIHHYWLRRYDVPGTYEAIEIAPADLAARVAALRAGGYTGFNVTIPHKQAVMALCDTVDDEARRIGAVNTVSIGDDGSLRGSNTDARGFVDHLRHATGNEDLTARPVLILGAGGAARAIVDGLQTAGFKSLSITNRTNARAAELATEFGITAVTWGEMSHVVQDTGLLINTTAGGMAGKATLDFDAAHLNPGAIVCDIVYTPRRTALLEAAAARGCRAVEGLGMLIQQARLAFEIWTGVLPDADAALEQLLYKRLES